MMKREFLSAIVLLLTVSAAAVSCGESAVSETVPTASDTDVTEAVTEKAVPENVQAIERLFLDTDYQGKAFRIYSYSPGEGYYFKTGPDENEIWYEAESGDLLQDAVYHRNLLTENLLNVKITPVWAGTSEEAKEGVLRIIRAGEDAFDAALNDFGTLVSNAGAGYFLNLCEISSMDLSHPWWDAETVSVFTRNGQLYALSGDINYYDDYAVQALFFTKKLLEDNGLPYPYADVAAGTWTFERFMQLSRAVVRDMNGDSVIDVDHDIMGYCNHAEALFHMSYAAGEAGTSQEADGTIRANLYGDRLVSVVDSIFDFITDGSVSAIGGNYIPAFKEGRVLFFADMVGALPNLRDMEPDFGVLPMPKYDEAQTRYSAFVAQTGWMTAYALPSTNPDPDFSGTVLETMCAYSTDTVMTTLYDVLLENKLIRDRESQEMLAYVFDSKLLDWAVGMSWADPRKSVFTSMVQKGKNNFVSDMTKAEKSIEKARIKFFDAFDAKTENG